MKKVFAVIHTWPGMKNAEYEVIQRVLMAGENVGVRAVVIDNNGLPLWWSEGLHFDKSRPLEGSEVDFLLSLHFESPRIIDAYSYITLWQPIEFYHSFGYTSSIDKLRSHNDLLSCASDFADAHASNLLVAANRLPERALLHMFHATPQPYLTPNITETSRLFYIGINWERLGKAKGRFHDALMWLDARDIVDIYGPEEFLGVAPWAGFESYNGEIPFDGISTMSAINRSGICLALSSTAHKNVGIMSNRLFEGFAGGAAVIATPNRLIDKFFKDVVYEVDDSGTEIGLARRIEGIVQDIRRDPKGASERVLAAQAIIQDVCSLEASIEKILSETPVRKKQFLDVFTAPCEITVFITHKSNSSQALRAQIANLSAQQNSRLHLVILCDKSLIPAFEKDHIENIGSIASHKFIGLALNPIALKMDAAVGNQDRTGPFIAAHLRDLQTEYFAFAGDECDFFCEHFSSLAAAVLRTKGAQSACSGVLEETIDALGKLTRKLGDAKLSEQAAVLNATYEGHRGRFLFSADLVRKSGEFSYLLHLLDGYEHVFFRLAGLLGGPIAQTSYHTYLAVTSAHRYLPDPAEPRLHQQQYIRDFFAGDPEWLKQCAAAGGVVTPIYAYSPGSPVRWENYRSPYNGVWILAPNKSYKSSQGGDGLKFLGEGFSFPESDGIWVEGPCGVLSFAMEKDLWPEDEDHDLVLLIEGRDAVSDGETQDLAVMINGALVGYQRVPEAPTEIRFRIPRQMKKGLRAFRIELHPTHAEMAYSKSGQITDGRRLSVKIKEFSVSRSTTLQIPQMESGKRYKFSLGETGTHLLLDGFYKPEVDGTWIAGNRGVLSFRFVATPDNCTVVLTLSGRRRNSDRQHQTIEVFVFDEFVSRFDLVEHETEIKFQLPPSRLLSAAVEIRLVASHAEAVYDGNVVVDSRLLGIKLLAIQAIVDRPWPSEQDFASLEPFPSDRLFNLQNTSRLITMNPLQFYEPDGDIVWLNGTIGTFFFRPPAEPGDFRLWLTLRGPSANLTGAPQSVIVRVNGANLPERTITDAYGDYIFEIDASANEAPIEVQLVARHAERDVGNEGNPHSRVWSLALGKIGLVSMAFLRQREEEGVRLNFGTQRSSNAPIESDR